jgi:hypothetical protein
MSFTCFVRATGVSLCACRCFFELDFSALFSSATCFFSGAFGSGGAFEELDEAVGRVLDERRLGGHRQEQVRDDEEETEETRQRHRAGEGRIEATDERRSRDELPGGPAAEEREVADVERDVRAFGEDDAAHAVLIGLCTDGRDPVAMATRVCGPPPASTKPDQPSLTRGSSARAPTRRAGNGSRRRRRRARRFRGGCRRDLRARHELAELEGLVVPDPADLEDRRELARGRGGYDAMRKPTVSSAGRGANRGPSVRTTSATGEPGDRYARGGSSDALRSGASAGSPRSAAGVARAGWGAVDRVTRRLLHTLETRLRPGCRRERRGGGGAGGRSRRAAPPTS